MTFASLTAHANSAVGRDYLLDTNVVLWALAEPRRLSEAARVAMEDARNEIFVSVVSGWEIAIKRALGKAEAPDDLEAGIREQGFTPLLITFHQAERAGVLPPHHRDPFDRILIAQAQAEGLILVTRDPRIPVYGVRTMAA